MFLISTAYVAYLLIVYGPPDTSTPWIASPAVDRMNIAFQFWIAAFIATPLAFILTSESGTRSGAAGDYEPGADVGE
jgi:hypothetical protein